MQLNTQKIINHLSPDALDGKTKCSWCDAGNQLM